MQAALRPTTREGCHGRPGWKRWARKGAITPRGGATGVIGRAIAERLAAKPSYRVVLLGRDAAKAQAAVTDIQRRTGNNRVAYQLVDLARPASVAALAEDWNGPLHVLINNAVGV